MNEIIPREQELRSEALAWPDQARALTITDNPTYLKAGEMLTGIKGLRKQIDDNYGPVIEAAHKAHKAALAAKAAVDTPLSEAEKILKAGMARWHDEQERARKAEEARLAEEARKREEEARLAEAEVMEADGDAEAAMAHLDTPVIAPVVKLERPAAPAGISYRETWRAEVTDKLSVIRFVAQHPEWLHLLDVSMPQANAAARAQRSALAIPGLKAVADRNTAVRA